MPDLVVADHATSALYAGYAEMRGRSPVARSESGAWIVTRHADASRLLSDARLSHWRMPVGQTPFGDAMNRWLEAIEPRGERGLRRAIRECADPGRLRATVRDAALGLEGMLLARRRVDLIGDLARPFTLRVAASLLGISPRAHERFVDLVSGVRPHLFAAATPAGGRAGELREFLLTCRGERDGWIGASAELNEDDFLAFSTFLLFAAHDNMMNFIGNAFLALHQTPEVAGRLRTEPALWPTAVDELLRYDSPVQFVSASSAEEIELGGISIPPGESIWIGIGSANRDPERFADPDRLIPDRADNGHLSFGLGAMRCVGAGLAKLEGVAALTLALRLENVTLEAPPLWRPSGSVLRGLDSLLLAYEGLAPGA